ncbi:unnamed protein product [Lactuca virosa]|uniref:DUF4283 domain-containing protein n=1 Tax=Lactuca virosa TaxID=75947 RepID=A0AAU9MXV8_9ASTR|nr:unnamed protein product [Lactuca virosa]
MSRQREEQWRNVGRRNDRRAGFFSDSERDRMNGRGGGQQSNAESVKHNQELERRLCELWFGNYHVFASIYKFTRQNQSKSDTGYGKQYQKKKTSELKDGDGQKKKSYAKAIVGEGTSTHKDTSMGRKVIIGGRELTGMTEVQSTVLAEVREAASIPNLINLCSEEGFSDIKIRYVGGLWVVVSFESAKASVWLEILGLPMCTWNPCVFKKIASVWGSVLFSDDYENNCMSTGKVCVFTGIMASIHESLWVTIEGTDYQEDNNSFGSFDEGEGESFGFNSDKENKEHDRNREDVNVNEVNSEPDFIQEVEKINDAGNDEIGNNNRPHNVPVQSMGIGHGSASKFEFNKMENVQSEDQRSSASISKPPGFGGKVFKETRGPFQYSEDNLRKSWSTGSVKILKNVIPSVGANSCEEVSRFIELGKILGYDVENAKADLKNRLVGMGVLQSL